MCHAMHIHLEDLYLIADVVIIILFSNVFIYLLIIKLTFAFMPIMTSLKEM